ncbi:hypothetical protein EHS25_006515 [Saitozyma podzolica]|uniref:DUF2423 domain-containing protein n=1 Tax=Saitozyma podzolica TaxID=1890683 RepID=A0A427YS37_9TREE|nr:hypothetical protein EHS25_006515 [Saitozyma podzolica]
MAKSLRSKVKNAARRKRRTQTHYAVAGAERVQRISDKLLGKGKEKADGDAAEGEGDEVEGANEEQVDGDATMEEAPKKVSTSAPRDSRRESWRLSKGMSARPKSRGQNSLGQSSGRRNAGRPKRRR